MDYDGFYVLHLNWKGDADFNYSGSCIRVKTKGSTCWLDQLSEFSGAVADVTAFLNSKEIDIIFAILSFQNFFLYFFLFPLCMESSAKTVQNTMNRSLNKSVLLLPIDTL